jgi:hypothetical protein
MKYANGRPVEGHKVIRNGRRWCNAKILYVVRTREHELGEAYMIEFADGSRGVFDTDHIRPVSRETR